MSLQKSDVFVFPNIRDFFRAASLCRDRSACRNAAASSDGDALAAAPTADVPARDEENIFIWRTRVRDDAERLADARRQTVELRDQIVRQTSQVGSEDGARFPENATSKLATFVDFYAYLQEKNETAAVYYKFEVAKIFEAAAADEKNEERFFHYCRRVQEVFETCAERIFYDELKKADDEFDQTPLPKDFTELLRKCLETPLYCLPDVRLHCASFTTLLSNKRLDKLYDSRLQADDSRRMQQKFNAIIRRCLTEKEIQLLIDYYVKRKTFKEIAKEHGEGLTDGAYRRRRADILERLAEYPAMQEFAQENNLNFNFDFKKKRNKSAKNRKENADND